FFGAAKWRRKGRKARRWRKGPARALAGHALDRAWGDCCSHGSKIAGMTDTYRHEFRKNLKSLRYLCDFFVPLWPDDGQTRFLRGVHDLQDALGTLNDLTMATADGALSVQTEEAFDQRFRQAMTEGDRIWRKLRKSGPWWC
ncbi:MAG TPA: CHAD domain-containing protein, partial [Paracoccaceae bacterium]